MSSPFNVFRQERVFKRRGQGTYLNGRFYESDFTYFRAPVSLQPMTGVEVQHLPEGRRDSGTLKCYTDLELVTVRDANPDILIAFGYEYELVEVQPWLNNLITHYKVMATKIGPAPKFIDEARIIVTGELRITAADEFRGVN